MLCFVIVIVSLLFVYLFTSNLQNKTDTQKINKDNDRDKNIKVKGNEEKDPNKNVPVDKETKPGRPSLPQQNKNTGQQSNTDNKPS